MFFTVGQTAVLIGANLGTQIYLDPGIVSGKSKSKSQHHRYERIEVERTP